MCYKIRLTNPLTPLPAPRPYAYHFDTVSLSVSGKTINVYKVRQQTTEHASDNSSKVTVSVVPSSLKSSEVAEAV